LTEEAPQPEAEQASSSQTSPIHNNNLWTESIWPGLGLFGESYLLFSVGTLGPLWQRLFPTLEETSSSQLAHITYAPVCGVIMGMLLVGCMGGVNNNTNHNRNISLWSSRRWGSIGTATFMVLGATGLVLTSFTFTNENVHVQYFVTALAISLFVFGIGIGGEYPLAASVASEKAMIAAAAHDRQREQHLHTIPEHDTNGTQQVAARITPPPQQSIPSSSVPSPQKRGFHIQMTFSMQGAGIFVHCLVLWILLKILVVDDDEYNNNNRTALLQVWQSIYVLGLLILVYVLISRILYLEESAIWQQDQATLLQQTQQQQSVKKMNEDGTAMHITNIP
jgi:hypothetical protein